MELFTWATQFVVSGVRYAITLLWQLVDSVGAYGAIISLVSSVVMFRYFIRPMFGGSDKAVAKKKGSSGSNEEGS